MQLGQDMHDLHASMNDLARFLDEQHELFRSSQVRTAAKAVGRSDPYGVLLFLSLFGGMGSLNDLVLQRDGGPLGAENDRLDELRREAADLATKLFRDIDWS